MFTGMKTRIPAGLKIRMGGDAIQILRIRAVKLFHHLTIEVIFKKPGLFSAGFFLLINLGNRADYYQLFYLHSLEESRLSNLSGEQYYFQIL